MPLALPAPGSFRFRLASLIWTLLACVALPPAVAQTRPVQGQPLPATGAPALNPQQNYQQQPAANVPVGSPIANGQRPTNERPAATLQSPLPAPDNRVAPPQVPQPPQAPFQLTAQQQAALDRVLLDWERKGKGVKNFEANFTRLEYDQNGFGPPPQNGQPLPITQSTGTVKYAAPDKGMYHVSDVSAWDAATKKYKSAPELREKWISNGTSIFSFEPKKKQLIETKLPPELQGKAISDGPLPFLFGSEAAVLAKRYYLRLVTPPEQEKVQVWIEARPKFQRDATNFQAATMILNAKDLAPAYLELIDTANKRTVHAFDHVKENAAFEWLKPDFWKPGTPLTWTYVLDDPAAKQPPSDPRAPSAGGAQAQRPGGPIPR